VTAAMIFLVYKRYREGHSLFAIAYECKLTRRQVHFAIDEACRRRRAIAIHAGNRSKYGEIAK
jgi:hypothetical protein